MPARHILAIDQGTTGTTTLVFDSKGQVVGRGYSEIEQHYPRPGWVEHDADEIWRSVVRTADAALADARISGSDCAAIGITNQRETTVVWDRATGRPVHRAIVWQCRRSAPICDELCDAGHTDTFRDKTGLVLDAYFSGTKLTWLFRNHPDLAVRATNGELAFGTIDSWLIWRLTRGRVHATDFTNASRTLLFDIDKRVWDDSLCGLLGVPPAVLPVVLPSSEEIGCAEADEFPAKGVPIAGVAGDQQAALFGQGCIRPGDAKNTYGTGCFLLFNTGEERHRSHHGLLETLAVGEDLGPCHALEGSVFIGGALIQWLRDELRIIDSAADSEVVARECDSSKGVHVIPAFVGLGAPWWDMRARGAITGLTRGAGRSEIVRASLEAIAYQSRDVAEAMEKDAGVAMRCLKVDGGATANDLLMQFQSDLLGIPVDRPVVSETTAAGAAYLAGLAVGLYAGVEELAALRRSEALFEPKISKAEADALHADWLRALARVRIKGSAKR
ncbi:MAG: glycerol kinase [Gemmatimonadetes bacterium]|nr:glycerol kinase [Gemmatimonadota bacterium]